MNIKKTSRVLIVGMSMNMGGAEKSLINLLNMIDYSKYEVDLLLFQNDGPLLKYIPDKVNFLNEENIRILYSNVFMLKKTRKNCLNTLRLSFIRLFSNIIEQIKWKQFDRIRLHRWIDYYRHLISKNNTQYDIAIAYAGGETAYYIIDKTNADRKIYYFHSDYSEIDIDVDGESKYVEQADLLVTVSNKCKDSLIKLFPSMKDNIIVLQNLSSSHLISQMSEEYAPSMFANTDAKTLKIVSVGRLHSIKGYDMAIKAAKILLDNDFPFIWVVIGEGDMREQLEKDISLLGLDNHFFLVGMLENPYPYMKNADIIVQTSRFEGKSLVLDEAKILKKPVLCTNYNSVRDQITEGVNGFIVDMNEHSIAKGLMACNKNNLYTLSNNIESDSSIEDVDSYLNSLKGR